MAKCDKPKTSSEVATDAGIGLAHPRDLSSRQEQSLAGSVLAHLPRKQKRRVTRSRSRRRTTTMRYL